MPGLEDLVQQLDGAEAAGSADDAAAANAAKSGADNARAAAKAVWAWRDAVSVAERFKEATDDWCRLAADYERLAKALRAAPAAAHGDDPDYDELAARAFLQCARRRLVGKPTGAPNPRAAVDIFRRASLAFAREAQNSRVDCASGDAYYAAAQAMTEAADAEPDAVDAISDRKQAAELFRLAAKCYKPCGDDEIDSDPLAAHGAYHREVISHASAEEIEGGIERHYKASEPAEDTHPLSGHGPATQHGKARVRKERDHVERGQAGEREKAAREKYLLPW